MELQTPRLTLRELHEDDWPDVLAYQSDPRYLEFYEAEDRTPEDVRSFVKMLADLQHERPRRKFQLVTLSDDACLIGNCGIRRLNGSDIEADIGYELAPVHWGKGYATDAVRAIVAFGFTELGVHRISARCIADNGRSVRVLEKLGMWQEDRLLENEWFKGRSWDTLVFALNEPKWRRMRPR